MPYRETSETQPVLLRLFLWLFSHTIFRVTVINPTHVPETGGALLVSNHISFADMVLVLSGSRRFAHFLLPQEVYDLAWLQPFLRYLRVIPLPSESEPRELIRTVQRARDLIARGEVVGIFAERSISRIGITLPFRREFERIMEGVDAPIIPVCLDGVWGSIFSYQAGRFLWKMPRHISHPVSVSFGKPLPGNSSAFEVRAAIQELNTDAWAYRRKSMKMLHRAFVQSARKLPFRFAMADARVPRLNFGGALTKTTFLARRLRSHWLGQEMVGILLPPSVAGALANHAALLMGKVPVNLNYTLSEEALASCARQCGLQSVLTSKAFLEKLKVKPPGKLLLLEDIADKPRIGEKFAAFVLSWLTPAAVLEKGVGRERAGSLDDLATIIFSSGSTGEPKGVMLTHYNIASNAMALSQLLDFRSSDRFLGILPFFHSFGFTATLTASAAMGIGVAYHPSPLDSKAIAGLVRRYRITYIIATPTFLQIYMRNCQPGDFGSVRAVMASAEKLPAWLARAFEEKFGIRPMEGYGCTECAPVVTCSRQDFRAPGFHQVGSRPGSIGQPLPGVSVRIVDPDTRDPLPQGRSGLLLVRGPNVMRGYLNLPQKTAEAFHDGWYVTGDIALIDEEGFLHITDRLSRFSKIGGEMVPHVKVEEKLHEVMGLTESTFAVCGVPDPKKGEQLVVLHTLPEERLPDLFGKLQQLGLPNLWVPRPTQFFRVDKIPVLATGKMNLRAVREVGARLANQG